MVRILKEKKGDLKFAAKGIIALIAILLIANFYGTPRKVANAGFETANKVTEDLGLNDLISIPKIISNTLSLNSEKALVATFKLNKDGEKLVSGAGNIRVIFSYRELPDDSLRDVCTAFRVAGSGGSSQEEANHAKGFDCDISDEDSTVSGGSLSTAVLNSWISGEEKPAPSGEYRATISIKGKSDKDFQEGKESLHYKFYTEEYVEMLNKQIGGCFDDFGNCNVIECKKQIINFYFLNPQAPGALQLRKDLVVEISEEFRKERGYNLPNKCGTFESVYRGKINFFKSDECTDKDIDDLNIKVARARLLESAFESTGQAVKSENDYKKWIDLLDLWKKEAIDITMSCTKTWNVATTIKPKGAFSEMEKLGWTKVGSFDKQEGKIKAELDRVLKDKLALQ